MEMAKHEKQTAVTDQKSEVVAVTSTASAPVSMDSIADALRFHGGEFNALISLASESGDRHYEAAFTDAPMTAALFGDVFFYVRDVMVWQPAGTMSMGDMVKSVGISDAGQLLLFKDRRRRMGTPKQITAVGPLEDITVVIPENLLY